MPNVKINAIIHEISAALENLLETGKTHIIFLGKIGLTEPEQVELLQELGEGELKISLSKLDEPVDWYESALSGVWVGTFRNHRDEAVLRTIEVCYYPSIAASQKEDIKETLKGLN